MLAHFQTPSMRSNMVVPRPKYLVKPKPAFGTFGKPVLGDSKLVFIRISSLVVRAARPTLKFHRVGDREWTKKIGRLGKRSA